MGKKKAFNIPYVGFDNKIDYDILLGEKGNGNVCIEITNNIGEFSCDKDYYVQFHQTLSNIVKILGDNHYLQKLDIICKSKFSPSEESAFLQKKYNEHFEGRVYNKIQTILVIGQSASSKVFKYNAEQEKIFSSNVEKIFQILSEERFKPKYLRAAQIENIIKRIICVNFDKDIFSLDNIQSSDTHLTIGDKFCKSTTLIDIDLMGVPKSVMPYSYGEISNISFRYPTDYISFFSKLNDYDTIIYNQVISIPPQTKTLQKLEMKKKRHESFADPANRISSEDIEVLLEDVAQNNQLIVNGHINIFVVASSQVNMTKTINTISSSLFTQGIICGKNNYNQMELFRTLLPGNIPELQHYDFFVSTSDAVLCFFFKESFPKDEDSRFYLRFTDRQGVPIKIDPCDIWMKTGRLNNRNKFVLGPSGSGKSFLMNAIIERYMLYNMDIVIIDTGDSYSGISSYYGGKYITYKQDKPITMNPFLISPEEWNIEKKDFLISLILLLWKGAAGEFNIVESDLIGDAIEAYFYSYFHGDVDDDKLQSESFADLFNRVSKFGVTDSILEEEINSINESLKDDYYTLLGLDTNASLDEIKEKYRLMAKLYHPDINKDDKENNMFPRINEAYTILSNREKRKIYDSQYTTSLTIFRESGNKTGPVENNTSLMKIKKEVMIEKIKTFIDKYGVKELSFNSFYEFSLKFLPYYAKTANVPFNVDEFSYVLKKFYKGGVFDTILNESADTSLFEEQLIVFEIDNIKDNATLFPIVTLVIMDVFIQKMRLRKDRRKALVIEEAWKAIANKLMGNYITFLYKTVRKFWGECIVVTQELNDIIGNPVVKDSIINNSDSLILLDQTKFKDNFTTIAELLSLNEVEQTKIFTINNLDNKNGRSRFKEFYFKRGAVGEVYGNEVSIFQYLAYTTEKPEKNAVEIYMEHYGNFHDAVEYFVRDMNEVGIQLSQFVEIVNGIKAPLKEKDKATFISFYKRNKNEAIGEFINHYKNVS